MSEKPIIYLHCRALACPFVRNESLVPQGIFSCASAIHLIGRPYARLRTLSSESVANKEPAQSSRRFMNNAGVRPESCTLSDLVKGQTAKKGMQAVTESCGRIGNDGSEA